MMPSEVEVSPPAATSFFCSSFHVAPYSHLSLVQCFDFYISFSYSYIPEELAKLVYIATYAF